mmetsp:Transcript_20390/g.28245  ORF Transcript_20390/g.28245 Transcript_20390/m.28245 type:complete len:339 (+) Transcript_20390:221-1237(+)
MDLHNIPNIELLTVSEPSEDLTCSVCLDVLMLNATTLNPCGHTLCKKCCKDIRSPKTCPMCRKNVKSNIPNFTVRNIVGRVQIRCPNSMRRVLSELPTKNSAQEWERRPDNICCPDILPFEHWAQHHKKCKYTIAKCPKFDFGCHLTILEKDLNHHIQYECQMRTTVCPECKTEVLEQARAAHASACLFSFISCPRTNQGCNHSCFRRDMPKHLEFCEVALLTDQLKHRLEQQERIAWEIANIQARLQEETEGINIFVRLHNGRSKVYLVKRESTCSRLLEDVGCSNIPCTIQYEGKILPENSFLFHLVKLDSTIHIRLRQHSLPKKSTVGTLDNKEA